MGPFATALELGAHIGIEIDEPSRARAQWFLQSASMAIRSYTGQELSYHANDSVVLDPLASRLLMLPETPVVSVVSVTVDAVAFTSYEWRSDGMLWRTTFTNWSDGAMVVYNHGFLEGSVEMEMAKRICIDAASRAFTGARTIASVVPPAMGLAISEAAGWAPSVFLTNDEKDELSALGMAGVG